MNEAPATESPIREVRYIDITPSWSAILPVLLFGLEAGTPEGRKIAREELARMAAAADAYNASLPNDMTPEQIGEALKRESEQLARYGHYGASEALISFARQATPAELTRFRELIRAAE